MASIIGFDVIEINGTVIAGLANEDAGKITFPNESIQAYKGGGTAVAFKADADIAELELHVIRATDSDQYLAQLQHDQNTLHQNFTSMLGNVVKKYSGGIQEKITLKDGFFNSTQPEVTTSFSGNVDTVVSVYKMKFMSSERAFL